MNAHASTTHQLVPPPPETGAEFPVLDTLRAVGAFAVLTTHVAFWAGDYLRHGVWGTLLARLDVGVALFFVLSGFLLGRPWLQRAADGHRAPATAPYLWKRAVRILPLYVVAVTPALFLIEDNRDLDLADRVTTLLMLSTATGPTFPAGLTHMWSLAVEVSFYLVLPLLMLVLVGRRRRPAPVRLLGGLAVLIAVACWWHLDGAGRVAPHTDGSPLQWLPAYAAWFALGILLAYAQVQHTRTPSAATRTLVRLGSQSGSCWVLALGLLLVAATPVAGPAQLAPPAPGESLAKNLLYAGVGFVVVLSGVFADPAGRYHRLMTWGPLRRLGWISYGIFCVHLPLLHFVMWATGWPLFQGRAWEIWLLTAAVSVIAAELTYRLVERPALRLKRLVRERRPAATTAPTTGTSRT